MRSIVFVSTLMFSFASAMAVAAPAAKVWVNPDSKTYHCEGTQFYGKTKQGSYMTEKAAVKEGDKPASGKACS